MTGLVAISGGLLVRIAVRRSGDYDVVTPQVASIRG